MTPVRRPPRSIARVGERFDEASFHRWLVRRLGRQMPGPLPMGDDVAAVRAGRGTLLLTTDILSEGTHFVAASPPRSVGRAAIAASLSDIASKGGTPVAALLDLLLPRATPRSWAEEVVDGAERCVREFGGALVGGDTKASIGRAVVGTVLGRSELAHPPRRDAASPGDQLLVTGTVGRGGARAQAWGGARHPSLRVLEDLLRIDPRLAEGRALAPRANAMLDTSDGLADGARRLSDASGVRIVVDAAKVPWEPALRGPRAGGLPLDWALYGGDYELLASVPASKALAAVRAVGRAGGRATVVGSVERGWGAFLNVNGRVRPMPTGGWDPFAAPVGGSISRRSRIGRATFK